MRLVWRLPGGRARGSALRLLPGLALHEARPGQAGAVSERRARAAAPRSPKPAEREMFLPLDGRAACRRDRLHVPLPRSASRSAGPPGLRRTLAPAACVRAAAAAAAATAPPGSVAQYISLSPHARGSRPRRGPLATRCGGLGVAYMCSISGAAADRAGHYTCIEFGSVTALQAETDGASPSNQKDRGAC